MLMVLMTFAAALQAGTMEEQVQQAIRKAGAQWHTGSSWVSSLTPQEFRRLCGTSLRVPEGPQPLILFPKSAALPSRFDWRRNNGHWVTPVRNQGACGSCWDFSAVAQVETWYQIVNSNLNSGIDLSEQFVLSCGGAGTCQGGSVEGALSFFQHTGVPMEACFPYRANDKLDCSGACADWASQAVTIPGWGYVTLNEILIDNLKEAVYRHPVSASYTVFEDFQLYGGGVYEHVWGNIVGGHAVLIVGWDDDERCWIVKNSWGADWGEEGYFRIRWGDSGLGSYAPFVYDSRVENALLVDAEALSFTLTAGDKLQTSITLTNIGSHSVEFALFDSEVPRVFHITPFNAYDDFSWWCANPVIGGYANHWLQFLETPPIDLSTASRPQLNFMAYWNIEPPAGTDPPWDGWDGFNLWVSVDGSTFTVLEPQSPAYTCRSLWSFGHSEQGWNMGVGIPGWAGKSGGWVPVKVDLTPYRSLNTVIRFAFASDMGFSTLDDASMWGLFIDRIVVADGQSVLFVDEGENTSNMRRSGFGSAPAEWLNLSPGIGTLPPGGSQRIDLIVSAEKASPDEYEGYLHIECNDTALSGRKFPVTLQVNAAPVDAAVFARPALSERLFVGDSIRPTAMVRNLGSSLLNDLQAFCRLKGADGEQTDSLQLASLPTGAFRRVEFSPFMMPDTGWFRLEYGVVPPVGDALADNDTASIRLYCTPLVDDFESGPAAWTMAGGWGVTDSYGARSGRAAAHCSGGTIPYKMSMNAVMRLNRSFNIGRLDSLRIVFWASAFVEDEGDQCLVEISTDSQSWTTVYAFGGQRLRYERHDVSLMPFLKAGDRELQLRFRFVSNGSGESVGVFIDDVHFYGRLRALPAVVENARSRPERRSLLRSYPNPFNGAARIDYFLDAPARVELAVYSLNGRLVQTLIDQHQEAGEHSALWQPRHEATGVYFLRLKAATADRVYETVQKTMVIK